MIFPDIALQENKKYKICAFYTIAPSSIKRESLPAKLAKNLPHYPVPVFLLAQMAIHIDYQEKGVGENHFNQSVTIPMASQQSNDGICHSC